MSPGCASTRGISGGVCPPAVGGGRCCCPGAGQHPHQCATLSSSAADCSAVDSQWGPLDAPATLEDLQPDVLYHVLRACQQQDVAHLKMCSRRLLCNILVACQHWAPKVESWLAADPSSTSLLHQLQGAGGRQLQPPPLRQDTSPLSTCLPPQQHSSSSPQTVALKQQAAALSLGGDEVPHSDSIPARRGSQVTGILAADDSSCSLPTIYNKVPKGVKDRFDWRQVWSCLERAQAGPWQLDARRLTPAAFPHGVLLTFELLFQQPAPATELGAREQQSGGWRDCVTVLSFTLDGRTVEITVDASGRVTSPQHEWYQGCIKLEPGQPKLLALEISHLFPVAAWYLHPCTLAAPKLPAAGSSSSLASSSSCASSSGCTAQDSNWDNYSFAASSSSSGMSIAHSAALCSAVSSLSGASIKDSTISSGFTGSIGRPRLCLDLSQGVGSYVSDPRYIDEATRNKKPRGIERLELAGRVCWKPKPMLSWLNRLLPAGIRSHGSSGSTGGHASSGSTGAAVGAVGLGSGSSGAGSGSTVGSPLGVKKEGSSRPVCAVTVSKAAVWQVPEDPEFRFDQGFAFWVVQHKAEQLLQHYGVLPPCHGGAAARLAM